MPAGFMQSAQQPEQPSDATDGAPFCADAAVQGTCADAPMQQGNRGRPNAWSEILASYSNAGTASLGPFSAGQTAFHRRTAHGHNQYTEDPDAHCAAAAFQFDKPSRRQSHSQSQGISPLATCQWWLGAQPAAAAHAHMQVTPDAVPFATEQAAANAAAAEAVHQPRDTGKVIHSPDSDDGSNVPSPASSKDSSDMDDDNDAGPASDDVLALQRQLAQAQASQHERSTVSSQTHAANIHDLTAQLDNRFEALMLSPENQVPLLYNSLGRNVSLHGVRDGQAAPDPWGRTAVFGASLPSTANNSARGGAGCACLAVSPSACSNQPLSKASSIR